MKFNKIALLTLVLMASNAQAGWLDINFDTLSSKLDTLITNFGKRIGASIYHNPKAFAAGLAIGASAHLLKWAYKRKFADTCKKAIPVRCGPREQQLKEKLQQESLKCQWYGHDKCTCNLLWNDDLPFKNIFELEILFHKNKLNIMADTIKSWYSKEMTNGQMTAACLMNFIRDGACYDWPLWQEYDASTKNFKKECFSSDDFKTINGNKVITADAKAKAIKILRSQLQFLKNKQKEFKALAEQLDYDKSVLNELNDLGGATSALLKIAQELPTA